VIRAVVRFVFYTLCAAVVPAVTVLAAWWSS
jgi:hypothetical protein